MYRNIICQGKISPKIGSDTMPSVGSFATIPDPIRVAKPEPKNTPRVNTLVALPSFSFGKRSAMSELADGDKVDSPTPTPIRAKKNWR